MIISVSSLLQMKRELEEAKTSLHRTEGSIRQLHKSIEKEVGHSCTALELDAYIKSLMKKRDKLTNLFEKKKARFEKKWKKRGHWE